MTMTGDDYLQAVMDSIAEPRVTASSLENLRLLNARLTLSIRDLEAILDQMDEELSRPPQPPALSALSKPK